MKLYGCGECGSEYIEREYREEKSLCRFCVTEVMLEYIGDFDLRYIYPEYWEVI